MGRRGNKNNIIKFLKILPHYAERFVCLSICGTNRASQLGVSIFFPRDGASFKVKSSFAVTRLD